MYVLVADRGDHTYVLGYDGIWYVPRLHPPGVYHPKRFARRIHVHQFLKSRALGWFLGIPGPTRILTTRTVGL